MTKTTTYIQQLIEADLGAAEDNLYRAKMAARGCDPQQEWGESGETLQSIIDGYQRWVNKAKAALKEAQKG